MHGMCVRCRHEPAPEPVGLCGACVLHTRIEVTDGLRLLEAYLARWADFDDWLRRHGPPA
jgi:hypothetical protein